MAYPMKQLSFAAFAALVARDLRWSSVLAINFKTILSAVKLSHQYRVWLQEGRWQLRIKHRRRSTVRFGKADDETSVSAVDVESVSAISSRSGQRQSQA